MDDHVCYLTAGDLNENDVAIFSDIDRTPEMVRRVHRIESGYLVRTATNLWHVRPLDLVAVVAINVDGVGWVSA